MPFLDELDSLNKKAKNCLSEISLTLAMEEEPEEISAAVKKYEEIEETVTEASSFI